ncbi:DUF2029 domain-containing protein [Aureitalea sp. L0-47]|uniref:glycosyltransferase 87 family protein n=1 Tax=Aureitalea sp. L0-47 TaxID=2816962 RepID=UPI0022380B8A|nr:glycosyltransferase 87 family protein [Aureitalea sp. L0-47]MCW5518644.1 DUF2029 domain-containing protein [Aureitalea sp. L0-47]
MFTYLKTNFAPIVFALVCGLLYWAFGYELERHDFGKLISLYVGLFFLTYAIIRMHGWNFWLLAGIGVALRLLFLPAIPNLSQDFYRFIWDGQLVSQGVNPYLFTPDMYLASSEVIVQNAAELKAGMTDLNASNFSNYPPVNQLFFALSALFGGKSILGSIIVLRLLIILADIGILYFGKKLLEAFHLPISKIFWFFLNPFIILELTGNLHFEGVMLFFLLWSLYLLHKGRWFWAAVLFGISISTKLIPLLFLPLFYYYFVDKGIFSKGFWKLKYFFWTVIGTVVISFLPFISSEFISNFSNTIALWFRDFEFNASVFYLVRWIGFELYGWDPIKIVGPFIPIVVLLAVLALSFFRKNKTTNQLIAAMLMAISVYFLLSTTVHPWYVATPLLLCLFTRYRFPILWSGMIFLSYSAYGENGFSENLWMVALEYIVVIGFALWEILQLPKSKVQHYDV